MPTAPDSSLPLCEVLEQEYCALTGDAPPRLPDPGFTPAQILEPIALARRLIEGTDSIAMMVRSELLKEALIDLVEPYLRNDSNGVRTILHAGLNGLIGDIRLFDLAHRRAFDGVKFRSQTVDAIGGAIPMRNRLILEDAFPELQKLFDIRLAAAYQKLHQQRLRALCLSGGGIRSATFALGLIEGLARHDLLDQFDYLSTVSGGGYVGGWLSAWIARTSLPQVIAQLSRRPRRPRDPEPAPVRHLRQYSNYLTPRLGIFSADAWTLGATYIRNLLLNWVAFVPPLAALLSIPLLLVEVVSWHPVGAGVTVQYAIGLFLAAVAVAGSVAAVRYVHLNRPAQSGTEGIGLFDEKRSQRDFVHQCLGPLVVAAVAASICWAWGTSYSSPIGDLFREAPSWIVLGTIGGLIHLIGWMLAAFSMPADRRRAATGWWRAIAAIATGFAVGVAGSLLGLLAPPLWQLAPEQLGLYAWLAVPVLLAVIVVLSHLVVGYTSTGQSDAEREWSARFTGWMLIVIVTWFAGSGLVFSGPTIMAWIGGRWSADRSLVVAWIMSALASASGLGATTIARSPKTPAGNSRLSPGARSKLAIALAAGFIAWLVVLLSWSAGRLIHVVQEARGPAAAGSTWALLAAIAVVAGLWAFGIASGRLIDTNMFSLHAMYRARLIRAYLGASRPEGDRDPNRFTGFDDHDNVHLRELWPQPAPPEGNHRPFHVINATLNLVAGDNLAWQERKAESFTFSPLHCGSSNVGYRFTQDDPRDPASGGYGGDLGVSLGTALAVSGAAASPDMGYHSSPVLSLLLAFFNVRLGWWLGNPGHAGRRVFHRSSPESSLRPIVDEALGRTDDRNKYVYLSDGGHFENLGLYEMVLRRAHVIVVSDAGTDPACNCEDLGNAIRKVRIDLGIPIEIDIPAPHPAWTCAIGTVRYDCMDRDAPDGILLYIRPALTGSEPADVTAYAHGAPDFPHEPTVDQWFTESQFESYRALGSHIVDVIAGDGQPESGATLEWFARAALRRRAGGSRG